jgi:hypothetical protein
MYPGSVVDGSLAGGLLRFYRLPSERKLGLVASLIHFGIPCGVLTLVGIAISG